MKLRYVLPFLLLPFLPRGLEAQVKADANRDSLDVKTPYADVSLGNSYGLRNLVNLRGDVKLKFRDNAIYVARNGILNYSYGLNFDMSFLNAYHNASNQSNRTENQITQDSPIGEIITETTILQEDKARDFGIALNYRGFFTSYEFATLTNGINGSTLITIEGQEPNLVPFSSNSNTESRVYTSGFRNGFFQFIQNRQDEERFNNFLVNANYSFGGERGNRINLNVYYDKDVSGFFNFNFFRDIDLNLTYDSHGDNFRVNLSTSGYSRLHQRDFERGLENRLRVVPRIYDSNLETTRRYLGDMFFTEPSSYNFTIDKDEIIANLNLRNILFHYSRESQAIGLRYKFAIGTYDFEQNEARFGMFFGRGTH